MMRSSRLINEPKSQEKEIEALINVKKDGRKKFYLVKWKNLEHNQNTWEPAQNIDRIHIKVFEENYQKIQQIMQQMQANKISDINQIMPQLQSMLSNPENQNLNPRKQLNGIKNPNQKQVNNLPQQQQKQLDISEILQSKTLEKQYNQGMQEIYDSDKALFQSTTHFMNQHQQNLNPEQKYQTQQLFNTTQLRTDLEEQGIKDWALGSFWKYQDKPFRIQGVQQAKLQQNKAHQIVKNQGDIDMEYQEIINGSDRWYLIEWKMRKDGFKPCSCYISEKEIEEADSLMLMSFLEKYLCIQPINNQ
ncbi:Chromo domain containing protein [Oxytricha trifallax]|uniref:Chromo domain containing protein n=1 Tax=Oxytricha trifallax TaxID=1172189 RepID=A0A073HZP9_9SPIT|nr:Chromo domain containing protein [Oxytricha trifallax]